MWPCTLEHLLSLTDHGRGCFIGFSWESWRRGWGVRWGSCTLGSGVLLSRRQVAVLGAAPLHPVRCHRLTRGQRLCTQPAELRCGPNHFTPGALAWSAGCKASTHNTLWASETGPSSQERKVRLFYYSDSIFISWDLLMGFAGDTSVWRWHDWSVIVSYIKVLIVFLFYRWKCFEFWRAAGQIELGLIFHSILCCYQL